MTFATVSAPFSPAAESASSKNVATAGSPASWAASARLRPKSAM